MLYEPPSRAHAYTPERFVVVAHPGRESRSRELFSKSRLQDTTGIHVEEIPTTAEPAEYCDKLFNTIEPGDLVVSVGGDGITHHVGKTILEKSVEEAKDITLLPGWGGAACDLASMVNGRRYRRRQLNILRDGQQVDIWPLRSTITPEGGEAVHDVGLAYISFGLSALTSKLINHADHRQSWLRDLPIAGIHLQDVRTVFKAMRQRQPFLAETSSGTNIEIERLYTTGPRMGRHFRLPSRLTDRQFFEATVRGNDALHIHARMGSLLLGRAKGELTSSSRFTVFNAPMCQHDGEPTPLSGGTLIEIAPSERPLTVLSTKLI